ncbi:hypothetical protein [Rhizobacter sp. LjRoot28]|uniref:hypothetical protein n=1 Tax=Rhizobacter sp. LjRoot28 TaxID=3342309 RepID=UPI003ED127DA
MPLIERCLGGTAAPGLGPAAEALSCRDKKVLKETPEHQLQLIRIVGNVKVLRSVKAEDLSKPGRLSRSA